MDNSASLQNKDEEKNYIELIFYRFPKSNQEQMLKIIEKSLNMFTKEDIQYNYYKLGNTENVPGFTNIAKVTNTNSSEELWMDILSYKNKQHKEEFVSKMSKDKECQEVYAEFTKLLTPGSDVINGEFNWISI